MIGAPLPLTPGGRGPALVAINEDPGTGAVQQRGDQPVGSDPAGPLAYVLGPLHPEDLSGSSVPTLRLRVQPYVQLLELQYPVDDLAFEVRHSEDTDFTSNVLTENRKSAKIQTIAALEPKRIFLVVHRIDLSVYFRRIEREEFLLLSVLRRGKTIARAIDLAFQRSSISEFDRGGYVRNCFQTWATLGWFCRPQKNARGEKVREK